MKVSQEELNSRLNDFGIGLTKFCQFMDLKTGVTIHPKDIRKQLSQGELSYPMSAACRATFLLLERDSVSQKI